MTDLSQVTISLGPGLFLRIEGVDWSYSDPITLPVPKCQSPKPRNLSDDSLSFSFKFRKRWRTCNCHEGRFLCHCTGHASISWEDQQRSATISKGYCLQVLGLLFDWMAPSRAPCQSLLGDPVWIVTGQLRKSVETNCKSEPLRAREIAWR